MIAAIDALVGAATAKCGGENMLTGARSSSANDAASCVHVIFPSNAILWQLASKL
jgi:hypothetical protein